MAVCKIYQQFFTGVAHKTSRVPWTILTHFQCLDYQLPFVNLSFATEASLQQEHSVINQTFLCIMKKWIMNKQICMYMNLIVPETEVHNS